MFDKLIDLLVTFIHEILPFKIVDQWEAGVIILTSGGEKYTPSEPPFLDPVALYF